VVFKTRSLDVPVTTTVNGSPAITVNRVSGGESMWDSSLTGSPRTEVSSVDKFLADPTHRGDFHEALRQDNRSAGDAGLADFRVERSRAESTTFSTSLTNEYPPHPTRVYQDVVFVMPGSSGWPSIEPLVPLTETQLKQAGQRLYHRALPMKSQAELGTAIAEIAVNPVRALTIPGQAHVRAAQRQGRSIKKMNNRARKRHQRIKDLTLEEARLAADDYLAYVFGVRPNVQTLDDLAASLSRARRIAETVSRDGKKRIRRRRSLRREHRINTMHTTNSLAVAGLSNHSMQDVNGHLFTETSMDTWWAGSFSMSVSDTEDWLDRCSDFFHRIDYLTGIGIDVRVGWDLIPFSFVADWFANTGDFLENRQVVADYNIVCEYGYVMNHTQTTRTATYDGIFRYTGSNGVGYPTPPAKAMRTELTETKLRTRCSSFGFYTDFANLNAQQWASLLAIGVSTASGSPPSVRH